MNFKHPLVLVPDTNIQHNPRQSGAPYPPPVTISEEAFAIMSAGAHRFGVDSGFEFLDKPIYEIYNNALFKDKQFWHPLLERQFPIYIINPFCGALWPGDLGGMYQLTMAQTFWFWRYNKLWKVIWEIYQNNKCDGVMAFLPNIYNNAVFTEEISWEQYPVDDIWKYTDEFLTLSLQTQKITRELQLPNTDTHKQQQMS
jgi:hypothetical protein